MSTPFITFPGTSGNYISTDDVNLLDADTAHLQQSNGNWGGAGGVASAVLSSEVTPVFGHSVLKMTHGVPSTTSRMLWGNGTSGAPVVPAQEYSIIMSLRATVAGREATLKLEWFDSGGGSWLDEPVNGQSGVGTNWNFDPGRFRPFQGSR